MEIGITEAKRRWVELVDRASKGERFFITRWGHPVAALQFAERDSFPAERHDLKRPTS